MTSTITSRVGTPPAAAPVGEDAGNFTLVLDSIADLRAYDGTDGYETAFVKSWHEDYGKGGGMFNLTADTSSADDGGVIIVDSASPTNRRWKRHLPDGKINVLMFGAKDDGADSGTAFSGTDNTAYFQDAIDYGGANAMRVHVPAGLYRFAALAVNSTTALSLSYDYHSLIGDGPAETILLLDEDITSTSYSDTDFFRNATDDEAGTNAKELFELRDIGLRGRWSHCDAADPDGQNVSSVTTYFYAGTSFLHLFSFRDIVIDNIIATDCRNRFSRSSGSDRLSFTNSRLERIAAAGIRFERTSHFHAVGNTLKHIDDDSIQGTCSGIEGTDKARHSLVVMGNTLEDCEGMLFMGVKNATITGNTLIRCHGTQISVGLYAHGSQDYGNTTPFGCNISSNTIIDPLSRVTTNTSTYDLMVTGDTDSGVIDVFGMPMSKYNDPDTGDAYVEDYSAAAGIVVAPWSRDDNGDELFWTNLHKDTTIGGTPYEGHTSPGGYNFVVADNIIMRTLYLPAPQLITGVSQANPAVVTYGGADTFANSDRVSINYCKGMTGVNGGTYTVANVNAGANTLELSGLNVAVQNITAITKANPAVVTYSGSDIYSNGGTVIIDTVVGMTEVNGLTFTIANVNTTANTFELSGIDSSAYSAYVSGGTITKTGYDAYTSGGTIAECVLYSSFGFGEMFSRWGWMDPYVSYHHWRANGINIGSDINGVLVKGNIVFGMVHSGIWLNSNHGAYDPLTGVEDKQFHNILIDGNIIRDCPRGVGNAFYASGAVGPYHTTVTVKDNIIDCDPYFIDPARDGLDGTWAAAPGLGYKSIGIAARTMRGWVIDGNTISNCYNPILYNSALYTEHTVRGNILVCQPTATGYNASNKGIAYVEAGGPGFLHRIVSSDPTDTANYRRIVNEPTIAAAAMPSSGTFVEGHYVANSALTASYNQKLMGWLRITTGTGNTLDTDWREVWSEINPVYSIVKTSEADAIANSAALATDNALFFTLAANTKYRGEGYVVVTTGGTADFKYDIDVGAATTDLINITTMHVDGAASTTLVTGNYTAATGAIAVAAGAGTQHVIRFSFIVHVSGSGGSLRFRWAQNTSDAATTAVKAGSWIAYQVVK